MLIKVCGLKNGDNVAELLDKCEPDLLGMIFYEKSPRYIGRQRSAENRFPELKGQQKVGVFVNCSVEEIGKMQQEFGFEYVQLHGDEDVKFVESLKSFLKIKVIKVFRVGQTLDVEMVREFEGLADYYLFDTATAAFGGSGKRFDWALLGGYPFETPYLLSGGISEEDVDLLLTFYNNNPHMVGIDINSRFETEPGIKDPEKISAFIQRLKEGNP
jgi:phosphoribosylanthranilate isomerase